MVCGLMLALQFLQRTTWGGTSRWLARRRSRRALQCLRFGLAMFVRSSEPGDRAVPLPRGPASHRPDATAGARGPRLVRGRRTGGQRPCRCRPWRTPGSRTEMVRIRGAGGYGPPAPSQRPAGTREPAAVRHPTSGSRARTIAGPAAGGGRVDPTRGHPTIRRGRGAGSRSTRRPPPPPCWHPCPCPAPAPGGRHRHRRGWPSPASRGRRRRPSRSAPG